MSKYGNRKVKADVDGEQVTFDSVVERDRYHHLKLLEKAGEISNVELQPVYLLQESFKRDGKMIRAETYRGDFRYMQNGQVTLEDVKGYILTDLYKSKVKRLLFKHPELKFIEVYRKQKQWVEKLK